MLILYANQSKNGASRAFLRREGLRSTKLRIARQLRASLSSVSLFTHTQILILGLIFIKHRFRSLEFNVYTYIYISILISEHCSSIDLIRCYSVSYCHNIYSARSLSGILAWFCYKYPCFIYYKVKFKYYLCYSTISGKCYIFNNLYSLL